MSTLTKKVISAFLAGALTSAPILYANNEEVVSPFKAVVNAATKGSQFPIVINHHTTQHIVQNQPATQESSVLHTLGSYALIGCNAAFSFMSTQTGLACSSTLIACGLAYYNRKVIKQTVISAHEKTRELFNQKMSELKNNLDTLTKKVSAIKEHITQENSNLKTWLGPLFSSNKEQLEKLQKQLQELTTQLQATKKEKEQLQELITKATEENKQLHETSHSEIQKLRAGQEAQQKQLELLTKTIDNLNDQIEGLKNIIGTPTDKQTTIFSILKYLPTFGLNN